MLRLSRRLIQCKKGAALVEYALLVAGVALIGAASVATFGHKTNDMIGMVATILPGAHTDDNAPIVSGKIIETTNAATHAGAAGPAIGLDASATGKILAGNGTDRLDANLGFSDGTTDSALVLEAK
jgi:pilus assembly protein Flp/PilA